MLKVYLDDEKEAPSDWIHGYWPGEDIDFLMDMITCKEAICDAQIITTVEEFIATDIQRQGYWMVFNRGYNDVFAFKRPPKCDEDGLPCFPDEVDTDTAAREDFLSYITTHFPDIPLVEVFDSMPSSYLAWPYLGSIAIDMQPGSPVYKALSERYNDPEKDPVRNNAVLWTMDLGTAKSRHAKRIRQSEID